MSAENRLSAVHHRREDVVRITDIASMDVTAACAGPAFPNSRSIAGDGLRGATPRRDRSVLLRKAQAR